METVNKTLLQVQQEVSELAVPTDALFATCEHVTECDALAGSMMDLHHNVEALLPDLRPKVIQFTGSRPGEGVSTIVREYAWVAANRLGRSVLILDASHRAQSGQKDFFDIKNRYGWNEAAHGIATLDDAINRIGDSNLYVSGLSLQPIARDTIADGRRTKEFLAKLRDRFDLVLVDSPATTGGGTVDFTGSVDGVILVVEAEKTRWTVVASVRDRIQNSGSTILGVVLNKRQNHIPDFIYSRL